MKVCRAGNRGKLERREREKGYSRLLFPSAQMKGGRNLGIHLKENPLGFLIQVHN